MMARMIAPKRPIPFHRTLRRQGKLPTFSRRGFLVAGVALAGVSLIPMGASLFLTHTAPGGLEKGHSSRDTLLALLGEVKRLFPEAHGLIHETEHLLEEKYQPGNQEIPLHKQSQAIHDFDAQIEIIKLQLKGRTLIAKLKTKPLSPEDSQVVQEGIEALNYFTHNRFRETSPPGFYSFAGQILNAHLERLVGLNQ